MVTIPQDKTRAFLNKICSRVEQGCNHEKFYIEIDNMELMVPLIRNSNDIRDKLAGKMADQLRISIDDLVNLVKRKGKFKNYQEAYLRFKSNLQK